MGKAIGRSERNFCTELRQSAAQTLKPCFWWKIPDAGWTNHFDIVCCAKRQFIAIEAKMCKNKVSIPLVDLFRNRQHEIDALKRVRAAGGRSYILINIWEARKRNEILVLDPVQYEWLVSSVAPKKSIKIDDPLLRRECLFIEKEGGVYDLTKMI